MKRLFVVTALLMTAAAVAQAAPVLLLDPVSGAIAGQPGSRIGWGFTVKPDDTRWTSIIGVVLLDETNPSLGQFTDFISPQGGPVLGVLAPGGPDWIQTFDRVAGTGFGSYSIDPAGIGGQKNSGTFLVLYELFSDDPNSCGACFEESSSLEANFSVEAVPEPASWALSVAGLLAVAAAGRRYFAVR
jgi:hypothetical protein